MGYACIKNAVIVVNRSALHTSLYALVVTSIFVLIANIKDRMPNVASVRKIVRNLLFKKNVGKHKMY